MLKGTPTFNTDIAVARSSFWSGFGVEFLGEIFCQGALHVGPALTPGADARFGYRAASSRRSR